jgi:hypothetical protein
LPVCTLSGGQVEEAYLKVAQRHGPGEQGKRGIDRLAEAFGALVGAMEETRADILICSRAPSVTGRTGSS